MRLIKFVLLIPLMLSIGTLNGCGNESVLTHHHSLSSAPTATPIRRSPPAMSTSQVQSLYSAISSIPNTPTAFVNAYMRALATGSGLFARAYLSPSLFHTIPASIGTPDSIWHPWITGWKIVSHGARLESTHYASHGTLTTFDNMANHFTVVGYGSYNPSQGISVLFRDELTILSGGANPNADSPPYIISAQATTWLHCGYAHRF